MLKLRNLTLLRRLYVHALALITRLAYGPAALRRRPPAADAGAQSHRIRRINSELEFGPGAWEGSFLDAPLEAARAGGGRAAKAPPRRPGRRDAPFRFEEAGACLTDGMDAIVGDSLTRCFTSEPSEPWNFLTRNLPPGRWTFGPYVTLLWLLGLWVRYCVLLPIRALTLVLGFTSFCVAYPLAGLVLPRGGGGAAGVRTVVRKFLLRYLASVFVASWTGYVRFHGERPERRENQIYVANHTSLIDVFVLVRDYNFSCIGQRHGGLAGALQDLIGTVQQHVWFDREEGRDRKAVQRLLKEHVSDGRNEPMLVFPEGTCTTTDYCIMFKKGSFELDAKVYPIAMRYRKEFGDAFWNSTVASFPRHLFDLMTAWAVVCDVYYLEPMTIAPGETTVQFANRVKKAICDRAQLIDVNWDGFLKRHRISPKFLAQRQKAIAAAITRRLSGDVPRPWSTSTLSALVPHQEPSGSGVSPLARPPTSSPGPAAVAADRTAARARGDAPPLSLSRSRSKSIPAALHSGRAAPPPPVSPPARAAAAISAAATDAVRWGIVFGMLALAGAVTAVAVPASWRSALRGQLLAR
jgi:glycerol-3-phosphate O-acyltransferase 3/4